MPIPYGETPLRLAAPGVFQETPADLRSEARRTKIIVMMSQSYVR
jgi:hypothetical protein